MTKAPPELDKAEPVAERQRQRAELLELVREAATELAASRDREMALTREVQNCRANCFGGKVEGVRQWVAKERLEAAEAEVKRIRAETIEECARWHEECHAALASKPVWQMLSSHREYANAIRALANTREGGDGD